MTTDVKVTVTMYCWIFNINRQNMYKLQYYHQKRENGIEVYISLELSQYKSEADSDKLRCIWKAPEQPQKERLKVDSSKIVLGDFRTLLSIMVGTTKQKINKEIEYLNTINQLDLTDMCKMLHSTIAEYMFFSSAHRAFFRIDNTYTIKQP